MWICLSFYNVAAGRCGMVGITFNNVAAGGCGMVALLTMLLQVEVDGITFNNVIVGG